MGHHEAGINTKVDRVVEGKRPSPPVIYGELRSWMRAKYSTHFFGGGGGGGFGLHTAVLVGYSWQSQRTIYMLLI